MHILKKGAYTSNTCYITIHQELSTGAAMASSFAISSATASSE